MKCTRRDMSNVWTDWQDDFENCVETTAEAITEIYDMAINKVRHWAQNGADTENGTDSTSTGLIQILRHRRNLTTANMREEIEHFRADLLNLQADALPPLRTAFIGVLTEDAYHEANLQFGQFLHI